MFKATSISLMEIIALLASSFPELELLKLDLSVHQATYDVDDFGSILTRFPSLRVIYLTCTFARLSLGSEDTNYMSHLSSADYPIAFNGQACVKSGLLHLTSLLAKQVRTLDSFYMNEMGYVRVEPDSRKSWYLLGWLHVLNSNRDVGGTLEQLRQS
ncbi:hypothetical protein FB446DRAFT_752181 [Lentinula raphanica]|nr:hypothetical protein FB446DRAFT_752181 [Lentinula raphanica]